MFTFTMLYSKVASYIKSWSTCALDLLHKYFFEKYFTITHNPPPQLCVFKLCGLILDNFYRTNPALL